MSHLRPFPATTQPTFKPTPLTITETSLSSSYITHQRRPALIPANITLTAEDEQAVRMRTGHVNPIGQSYLAGPEKAVAFRGVNVKFSDAEVEMEMELDRNEKGAKKRKRILSVDEVEIEIENVEGGNGGKENDEMEGVQGQVGK